MSPASLSAALPSDTEPQAFTVPSPDVVIEINQHNSKIKSRNITSLTSDCCLCCFLERPGGRGDLSCWRDLCDGHLQRYQITLILIVTGTYMFD